MKPPLCERSPSRLWFFRSSRTGARFCITTTPKSRSGLLHPPAASFADSWKAVRAWHPPQSGGNDERGKSPNPRTGFPSFLESANPALPTFPPHGYCCCPRFNTPSKQIKATTTVALLATFPSYPQIRRRRHLNIYWSDEVTRFSGSIPKLELRLFSSS